MNIGFEAYFIGIFALLIGSYLVLLIRPALRQAPGGGAAQKPSRSEDVKYMIDLAKSGI